MKLSVRSVSFFPWDRWSDRSLRQSDVASVKISDMALELSRVSLGQSRASLTELKNPHERAEQASVIRNLHGRSLPLARELFYMLVGDREP